MKEIIFLFLFLITSQNCDTMNSINIDSRPKKISSYNYKDNFFYIYNTKNLSTIYFNITDYGFHINNERIEVCYTDGYPSDSMDFPTCFERRRLPNYGYCSISKKSTYFYKYNSDTGKRYLVVSFFGNSRYSGYIYVQASYDDLYEQFNKKENNISIVAIVFIVIGSVVFLVIIIILIICCRRRKIKNTVIQPNTVVNDFPSDNCVPETLFPANPVYPSPY